jgi:large subunit ribosomal protein L37Ae
MPKMKKVGPSRGLGPRYGSTVRKRYVKVMEGMKIRHKCPSCGFTRVKRKSVGVWLCKKCGFTFTGGAYTPTTKLGAVAKRSAHGLPVEEAAKATEAPTPQEQEQTEVETEEVKEAAEEEPEEEEAEEEEEQAEEADDEAED